MLGLFVARDRKWSEAEKWMMIQREGLYSADSLALNLRSRRIIVLHYLWWTAYEPRPTV